MKIIAKQKFVSAVLGNVGPGTILDVPQDKALSFIQSGLAVDFGEGMSNLKDMSFIVQSYFGMGDNIYQIPFIRQLSKHGEVFIHTPFPELFQKMDKVHCLPASTTLKAQFKNMQGNKLYQRCRPKGTVIRFEYGSKFEKNQSIMQSFEHTVPLDEWFFEFEPPYSARADEILKRVSRPICIVRLPSVRDEWFNSSRNGKMEYFQLCIDRLKKDYYLIAVGDIGNKERYDGPCPSGIDEHLDRLGENQLELWDMVYLLKHSGMVLSIPCNILPLCQILKKKGFFIYGGYVPHRLLNDTRFYQVGYVEPDPFCLCVKNRHNCYKEIPKDRLLSKLEEEICMN